MMSDAYVAVILIFAIVLAAACYAVRRLETRAARIAAALAGLALLVGALVPVVQLLTEVPPQGDTVVAPVHPSPALPQAPEAAR